MYEWQVTDSFAMSKDFKELFLRASVLFMRDLLFHLEGSFKVQILLQLMHVQWKYIFLIIHITQSEGSLRSESSEVSGPCRAHHLVQRLQRPVHPDPSWVVLCRAKLSGPKTQWEKSLEIWKLLHTSLLPDSMHISFSRQAGRINNFPINWEWLGR